MLSPELMQALMQDKAREASQIARISEAQRRTRGTEAPRSGPSPKTTSSFPLLSLVSRILGTAAAS